MKNKLTAQDSTVRRSWFDRLPVYVQLAIILSAVLIVFALGQRISQFTARAVCMVFLGIGGGLICFFGIAFIVQRIITVGGRVALGYILSFLFAFSMASLSWLGPKNISPHTAEAWLLTFIWGSCYLGALFLTIRFNASLRH